MTPIMCLGDVVHFSIFEMEAILTYLGVLQVSLVELCNVVIPTSPCPFDKISFLEQSVK